MKKFLLKQKIALLLIIISLSSLIVVGIVVYLSTSKVLLDNKKVEILSSTIEQSHESILTFKNNQLFVHMLSTRTRVKEFLQGPSEVKKVELTNIFSEYTDKEKKYLAVYLLDKNGVGLISTDPTFIGQDYSFREYFKKAINGEPAVYVAIGITSNKFGYYFADPVFGDNGNVMGVMVVKVDQSDIDTPVVNSVASINNISMLVDEFGVILFSSEEDRILKSLGNLTDNEKEILKKSGKYLGKEIVPMQYDILQNNIREYKNPITLSFKDEEDDDNELVSLNKIGEFPFYLVTEVRLGYLSSQIFSNTYNIILVIIILLSIISLSIYYFLLVFIRPLDKFKLFFTYIGNGDFSQELKVETRDEFADMALYINKMTKDLSDLYKNLENKVKERTKELEESQNIIEENLELSEKNNKMMINRELEMIKLKERIKELEEKLSKNV